MSLILLGLKIFHLFFGGNKFDTIYFLGVRLNDLVCKTAQTITLMNEDRSTRLLKFAEKMDDRTFRRIAQIAQRTYFFGSVIFRNLFFWV